jgi:hypothetical protein
MAFKFYRCLEVQMVSEDIKKIVHKRMTIQRIRRVLELAEIQSLTSDKLLIRLTNLLEDPKHEDLISTVSRTQFSHEEIHKLSIILEYLCIEIESLPSKQKANADRMLYRLLIQSPRDIALNIALLFLDSKRKARREIGLKVLQKNEITLDVAKILIKKFGQERQQKYLELIARNPRVVINLNVKYILKYLETFYWRMRVFEALINYNSDIGLKYSSQYPREFTHAVGRCKKVSLLGKLRELIDENQNDLEYISVYAWALMKIEAWEDIKLLREFVESTDEFAE